MLSVNVEIVPDGFMKLYTTRKSRKSVSRIAGTILDASQISELEDCLRANMMSSEEARVGQIIT